MSSVVTLAPAEPALCVDDAFLAKLDLSVPAVRVSPAYRLAIALLAVALVLIPLAYLALLAFMG